MSRSCACAPANLRRVLALAAAAVVVALGGCSAPTGGSAPATAPPTPTVAPDRTVYDLAYADTSPQQRLDLYLPAQATGPAPLVIWVHGGGWRAGDKRSIDSRRDLAVPPPKPKSCSDIVEVQVPDLAALDAKGYAVASINYRLTQDPVAAVQDAKAAVRFLRANASRYRLDPDRFAAWGNSAGAYSVIMLGVTGGRQTIFDDSALGNPDVPATVQAVVDWFGPTDASSMPGPAAQATSPFNYISAGQSLPPFMIAHGDGDCIVPPQQSRQLSDALTKAGGTATLTILPGAGHEDPTFMRTQRAPTMEFLDRTFGR